MGRNRTIDYAAFEVQILNDQVNHDSYVEMFNHFTIKNNRRDIPMKNNTYLAIQSINLLDETKPEKGFIGKIIKWNGITTDWFNDETGQKANLKDLEAVQIPDHLKANPRLFNFVCYPYQRKIICEISEQENEISENVLLEFFRYLLGFDKILKEKFKRIETSLVYEVDTIDNIREIKTLMRLNLVINRPEGVDLDTSEKAILKDMEDQNIYKYQKIIESEKGEYISLNDDIKKEMNVAAKFGHVEYKAQNEQGYVVVKSTSNTHPLIIREPYDPDLTQAYYVIQQVGDNFIQSYN